MKSNRGITRREFAIGVTGLGLSSAGFSVEASAQGGDRDIPPSMAANAITINGEVFAPDGLSWTGELIGSDEFVIAVIGSQGNTLADRITADRDGDISGRFPSLEPLSPGTATVQFMTYGTNGVFGGGEFEIDEDLAVAAFGDGSRTVVESTPQNLVSIVEGAGELSLNQDEVQNLIRMAIEQSVNQSGSQDLIVGDSVEVVDESETRIGDVVPDALRDQLTGIHPIEIGETMVVRGTTNRNPEAADINIAVTEGESADVLEGEVGDWPVDGESGTDRHGGRWATQIDVGAEIAPDEYTILVDDGEFVYEQTVEIVAEGTFEQGERLNSGVNETALLRQQAQELQGTLEALRSQREVAEQEGDEERVENLESDIREIEDQLQTIERRINGESGSEEALEVSIDKADSARVGEPLEVTATVTNSGPPVEGRVEAEVPGVGVQAKQVEVDEGSSTTVEFSIPTERGQAGTYTATVSTEGDSDSTDVEINQAPGSGGADNGEGNGTATDNGTGEGILQQLNDTADNPLVLGGIAGAVGLVGYGVYRQRGSESKEERESGEFGAKRTQPDSKPAEEDNRHQHQSETEHEPAEITYGNMKVGRTVDTNQYASIIRAKNGSHSLWLLTPPQEAEGDETVEASQFDEFAERMEPWTKMDDHENVLSVRGHGKEPLPWLALERGGYVSVPYQVDSLTTEQVLEIMIKACEGVHHTHRYGITYENLTPYSVMLTDKEEVKMFGALDYLGDDDTDYTAPEEGSQMTERAVIYRLGTIADEFLDDSEGNVREEVESVVRKARSKSPQDRHETVLHLRDEMQRVAGH